MLSGDPLFILLILGAGTISLIIFFIALFRGEFDGWEERAEVLFDGVDLRYFRPWETRAQREERRRQFGDLILAPPSEWGDGE